MVMDFNFGETVRSCAEKLPNTKNRGSKYTWCSKCWRWEYTHFDTSSSWESAKTLDTGGGDLDVYFVRSMNTEIFQIKRIGPIDCAVVAVGR